MKSKFILAALASVMAFGVLGGCTDAAQEEMGQAGENIGDAGTNVGSAVAKDADAAEDVVDNAGLTAKVKTALMTVEGVDSEHINVDTVDKTVVLKGTVDTEAAKTKAVQAAKLAAGDEYTIDDQLTVGGSATND